MPWHFNGRQAKTPASPFFVYSALQEGMEESSSSRKNYQLHMKKLVAKTNDISKHHNKNDE